MSSHNDIDLSPLKSNQFILESRWIFLPNQKKFPKGEILHSEEWYRWLSSLSLCKKNYWRQMAAHHWARFCSKLKVLYWSHIHNIQWNLFSAFNPEEQWAATGNRSTRREPTQTQREHANSTQKGPFPSWVPKPGPSCYEATVLTTTPLWRPCWPLKVKSSGYKIVDKKLVLLDFRKNIFCYAKSGLLMSESDVSVGK